MQYRPFTAYEQYIYTSRYSRWMEEEGRRETWTETVDRVVDCFRRQTRDNPNIDFERIRNAILNRDVMPSMRVMMTAGRALEDNHIAAYNCSYVEIDSMDAFAEVLYILMHGTGVGFSVKQESVDKLPVIGRRTDDEVTFVVPDSKEGWRDSVICALSHYSRGVGVSFDYSRVRPEGTRLRTFGGRASGPDPLRSLHRFLDELFRQAEGRQLNTLEVHSIVCKIAEVVVVGGVRRSALISLSDLSDPLLRNAKSGDWWVDNGHFALANNSAIYEDRPCREDFDAEWASLQASGSGERGIFNQQSARAKCQEIGRSDNWNFGTNPCGEIILRDGQFCNLTEVIIRPEDTLMDLVKKVKTATVIGTIQSSFDQIKGLRGKWRDNTKEERLLGVSMTGIMDNSMTNGSEGWPNLKGVLDVLRGAAWHTNAVTALALGISASAAITTVKPSGTVSQLCGTSSGIHPAHAQRYIRRVRSDKKDPLTQLMIDQGVPGETDFYNDRAHVFEFGIERPGSLTRDDMSAIEFLRIWKCYRMHWCDHNPSVTVSVKDNEWAEVGDWVYKNFDQVGGLSFLPHSEHTYTQAPYETSDELPAQIDIDFTRLSEYELDDETKDELGVACSAGVCEI